jgi:hypothetical protein
MDRLTEKVFAFNGTSCMQIKDCSNDTCDETCRNRTGNEGCEGCPIQIAIDKLAEYEDLEEQGKLLKLPCAVGDKVYAYCSMFGILEYEVDNIVISKDVIYQCSSYSEPIGDCPSECLDEIEPDISDFGRTVFLTRTEAERINEEQLLHVKYKIEEVIDAIVQADNEIICAIQHRDREGLEGALKDYLMRK